VGIFTQNATAPVVAEYDSLSNASAVVPAASDVNMMSYPFVLVTSPPFAIVARYEYVPVISTGKFD
jgi:hypothetical protein